MNILQRIRERIFGVIGAVFASIMFCICGAVFTFVLAPQQALEANRISSLPQMDAAYVNSAAVGEEVLVTGVLQDNQLLFDDSNLVAYELSEWEVTPPDQDSEENEPDGDWRTVETIVPDLNLNVGGQFLQVLSAPSVSLSGNLREELVIGDGFEEAQYKGEWLPEGSLLYEGFYDGDLATVLGTKASTGGIQPGKLYAGDRVAFEQSEEDAAKGMLYAGLFFMACAPMVLILGVLGAVFGRRTRRGFRLGR